MKKLYLIMACLWCITAYAQKEKPIFVDFLSDTELLVVYKTGLNTVFSVPDLSVKREFSLKDPKVNTVQARLSPAKDRLVTFDQKLKKRVIWDVATGAEISSIESAYGAPEVFLPDGTYIIGLNKTMNTLSFKMYNISNGSQVGDLDKFTLPYRGLTVSPSGNYLVNYNNSSLDEARFVVYDYKKSEKVLASTVGVEAEITSVVFNAREDSLKLVWRVHMATESAFTDFPVSNADFKPKDVGMQKYKAVPGGIYADSKSNAYLVGKDILIPLKDYSYSSGSKSVSPGNKWAVISNNKGTTLVVYDLSATEPVERDGEQLRKPREAGRFTSAD